MKKELSALNGNSFTLIAGPCVVEGEQMLYDIAGTVQEVCNKYNVSFVFKASFKKANRSKLDSFTGLGDEKALNWISEVGKHYSIPTTTDIHSINDASMASGYVDVLQIPAFLCRQTDLLIAAANTGKVVNIKKGQFLSPESMQYAVQKVKDAGNTKVWLTERGTTFGYQDLVVDFRSVPLMSQYAPVVVDCTHSLQQPNQSSGVTGGRPELIETIAKAAIATGAKGLFIETHPEPSMALSDGANMLKLEHLDVLIEKLVKIYDVIQ
jgi:2-dehydro-3-deoxyphosphooctonate aldolase (KDO 8-P synthase)